uniref:Transcriptional regulator n=1 Tax=Heterorhabditis bacteriophora TaxID=37862 RepID=A0A1I7WNU5_HETBA
MSGGDEKELARDISKNIAILISNDNRIVSYLLSSIYWT